MMNKKEADNTPKAPNMSQYKASSEELSYGQYRMARWYVRHKLVLRKIVIALLILWSAITLGYSGWQWFSYGVFGYFEDRDLRTQQTLEFINYEAQQERYRARSLDVRSPDVFSTVDDTYDFVTQIYNPNEDWMAYVTYQYVFSSGATEERGMLILPGQLQLLTEFGYESNLFPAQTQLRILDIQWRRIDAHAIADPLDFIFARLDFVADGFSFTRRSGELIPSDRLLFTVTNQSAYSYWQAEFFVVFLNRNEIVGVRPLVLDAFTAGETREVDFRFSGPSISISDIELIPTIQIFDPDVYMDPPTS